MYEQMEKLAKEAAVTFLMSYPPLFLALKCSVHYSLSRISNPETYIFALNLAWKIIKD
jgi:hypothetical protein